MSRSVNEFFYFSQCGGIHLHHDRRYVVIATTLRHHYVTHDVIAGRTQKTPSTEQNNVIIDPSREEFFIFLIRVFSTGSWIAWVRSLDCVSREAI